MSRKQRIKRVHEGRYLAEVEVELIEPESGWSPLLSLEDAYKRDDVREALRNGDLEQAARQARIFELTPVAV